MGILRNGLFGGFEKRTGPLVGRMLRGQNVVSMVQHRSLRPKSERQRDQQLKFAMVAALLKRFRVLIRIGFGNRSRMAFNVAMKYNLSRIIAGEGPAYTIDYARVVYSRGALSAPCLPIVLVQGANSILFSWLPEAENRFCMDRDQACFLVYNHTHDMAIIMIGDAFRANLGYSLLLPPGFKGELHCYMSFISATGHVVSNSVYVGMILFNM